MNSSFLQCIISKKSRWEDNGSILEDNGSIFIYTDDSIQNILNMPGKWKFSREEGFLGGLYLQENGARKAFGASVLNKFEVLTMHLTFKKNQDGRMTVVYILPLSSHILPLSYPKDT